MLRKCSSDCNIVTCNFLKGVPTYFLETLSTYRNLLYPFHIDRFKPAKFTTLLHIISYWKPAKSQFPRMNSSQYTRQMSRSFKSNRIVKLGKLINHLISMHMTLIMNLTNVPSFLPQISGKIFH